MKFKQEHQEAIRNVIINRWRNLFLKPEGKIDKETFELKMEELFSKLNLSNNREYMYVDSPVEGELLLAFLRRLHKLSHQEPTAAESFYSKLSGFVNIKADHLKCKEIQSRSIPDLNWMNRVRGATVGLPIKHVNRNSSSISKDLEKLLSNRRSVDDTFEKVFVEFFGRNPESYLSGKVSKTEVDTFLLSLADPYTENQLKHFKDFRVGVLGFSLFSWASYYDFFDSIGIVSDNNFLLIRDIILTGVFDIYMIGNIVIAVKPPLEIKLDDRNELHSFDPNAIEFVDGTKYAYLHGVPIEEDLWNKLDGDQYSFEDWIKEPNEEIKSACLEFIQEKKGSEAMFRFLSQHLQEVHTHVDIKDPKYLEGTTGGTNIGVYTLFKGSITLNPMLTSSINLAFVRCYCPSTDRMFFLGVDPIHTSAKDAIASLCRPPRKLVNHIKYLQRQGERFSMVLTETGKRIQEVMKEQDFKDRVGLSGDKYFSLMRYEY